MGFVDKQQKILREIVEQCKRRRTGFAPGHDSRIVLDSLAEAGFAKHSDIIFRALLYALRFEQFALNFAPDVTVLEPQRLREKVKSALKKALEKYE